jgi:DNA (cytosine-5)-methyltransferase 1
LIVDLVSIGGGLIKDKIISDFEAHGYTVVYKILKASDYGVPQNRKRVAFVGLLGNKEFSFPKPTHGINNKPMVTSYEALSDLPKDNVDNGQKYLIEAQSEYQTMIRKNSRGIYNHEDTNHTEQTINIISLVPDGGNYKSLPPEYQNKRNMHIVWTRINSTKPSMTIDTGHRHHFHYKWNRVPTVRESARLQSFPDSFIFKGSKTSQYKQVGNAVPPILAEAIAKSILKYI